jgi:hypothetical protein
LVRLDRQAKYRLTCRVSNPVASTAALGLAGIRRRARASATVCPRRASTPLYVSYTAFPAAITWG